ncbi:MAG: hypothetical protein AAGJ10_07195 [Bacteroidota bacterium]
MMRWLVLGVWMLVGTHHGWAQPKERSTDWAWTPIITHDGLAISYIFYDEADNENNGVVIKLVNQNAHAIGYRFKVIFRDGDRNAVEKQVKGEIEGYGARTGTEDGLFWIPFPDGRSIGEVGLKGYKVWRLPAERD